MINIKEYLVGLWPPWPFSRYGPLKKPPEKKKPFSWGKEAMDWIVAFVVVSLVYFVILPAILNTSVPLVVVSSCSEKGYINVGDVLVLQGVAIEDVNAPEVYVPQYTGFSVVSTGNEATSIKIGNEVVNLNRSNDIVVYVAYPSGAQIIHRVFAKVKTDNGYLLITKGDANPLPDQMSPDGTNCVTENTGSCVSTPITKNTLIGKAVFGVPLLGHVKLFFCDITFGLICEGHSNAGTQYQYVLNC